MDTINGMGQNICTVNEKGGKVSTRKSNNVSPLHCWIYVSPKAKVSTVAAELYDQHKCQI